MKKDVMIRIKSTQTVDGQKDVIEVLTAGSFYKRNSNYYIMYDETEATGFDGAKTLLRYEPKQNRVTMSRTGENGSQLIIEKGRRHQCNYNTGYGDLTIGVLGSSLKSELTENGGQISFCYSLDINTALTSENAVDIYVAEDEF